jgi:hypothetical protein
MPKSLLICLLLLFFSISLFAQNQLTIYNNDLSLVRTKLILKLDKGRQDYNYDDITSRIDAPSVIIQSKNKNLSIISQNYEYDLANSDRILQKFIGKDISLYTKADKAYNGNLQFFDGIAAGILENGSNKLQLVRVDDIRNYELSELPSNFYKRPTLHWVLSAPEKADYPVTAAYLTGGLSWAATYNAVWDDTNLQLNSWVTINNTSGKAFNDYKLKLVAGEVNRASQLYDDYDKESRTGDIVTLQTMSPPPEFTEKAFGDFHLYTLSENVFVADNQTKQMQLYPPKTVKAKADYEYTVYGTGVSTFIVFRNSEKDGLGVPLPMGTVKVYRTDEADEQTEFIGEDHIEHTPVDEEVRLHTGTAFDLVGETKVIATRNITSRSTERTIQVTLKNHSKLNKTITSVYHKDPVTKILNSSLNYEQKSVSEIRFSKELNAGQEFTFTWTENTTY